MIKLFLNFTRTGDYSSNVAPTWKMIFSVNNTLFSVDVTHAAAAEVLNAQVEKRFESGEDFVCYSFIPDPVGDLMSSEHSEKKTDLPQKVIYRQNILDK